MKGRVILELAGQQYEFVKTPDGENGCKLCALSLYCFNLDGDEQPCVELTQNPNWHFENVNEK